MGHEWMNQAACRGADPELFFPDKGEGGVAARKICRGCPVAFQCLVMAIETPGLEGIWGATTYAGRRDMRAARKRSRGSDTRSA